VLDLQHTGMVFLRKKWQYGFEPAMEVPVWHTIHYHLTSSPGQSSISKCRALRPLNHSQFTSQFKADVHL